MSYSPKDVLDFWFEDHADDWWAKNPAFDAEVKEKFSGLIEAIGTGQHDDWMDAAESCMAAVIVLDQMTRNAFRDSKAMYTYDAKARAFTKHAVAMGWDLNLEPQKRAFIYMPLEHSETIDDQVMCIACFTRFVDETGAKVAVNMLDYANKHKVIIDPFGRYPHRNKILGRESTEEEIEFLKGPGSSF